MKHLALLSILVILVGCGTSTDPTEPDPNNPLHRISLVPISGDLGKHSRSTEMLSFGDVASTKSLHFLLLNNSTQDAVNLMFTAQQLSITPSSIPVLGSSSSDLLQVPIISFTIEHVLPVSGAGVLKPMYLGEFEDDVELTYSFTDVQGDSIHVDTLIAFGGRKIGSQIQIEIDEILITTSQILVGGLSLGGYSLRQTNWGDTAPTSVRITNPANHPFRIDGILDLGTMDTAFTHTIQPGDTVELIDQFTFHYEMSEEPIDSVLNPSDSSWIYEYDSSGVFQYMFSPLIHVTSEDAILQIGDKLHTNGETWISCVVENH